MKIHIVLPKNRIQTGQLTVADTDGVACFGPVGCLGKSDNQFAASQGNSSRNPLLKGGDTPIGTYNCTIERFSPPVDEGMQHSYGTWGKVILYATGGDALIAVKQNGRSGLLIHGGDLNPDYAATGGLRPSHGCVRVSDENMQTILGLIEGKATTCEIEEKA